MPPLINQILLNTRTFVILDFVSMAVSFALASWASNFQFGGFPFDEFLAMRVKVQNFIIFHFFLVFWYMCFTVFGLYQPRRISLSSQRGEIIAIARAAGLGTLGIFLGSIVCNITLVTPVFLAVFFTASVVITSIGRTGIRGGLRRIRARNRDRRQLVIVGTNPRAIQFARAVEAKADLGYHLIGFVDEPWDGINEFRKTGYSLVSDFHEFAEFLRQRVVDEVVICLPLKTYYQWASQMVEICHEQGINVRYHSNIFNLRTDRVRETSIESDAAIEVYRVSMQGWPALAKRVLDFIVSLSLLILLLPLFLITAVLIKLDSEGPVFFVQERVGLNKRRFRMYKFRTMVQDAEKRIGEIESLNEVSGPVFKIRNDPRITAIGHILRKTSIDELPQLINVLKGDMSLVGPRPLPVRDYQGFDQDWHRRRFSVRPGMTCLWQVNGRSDIPFEKWMELDMKYIDQWSFWLDLKILAKTIPVALKGSGAA